MKTGNLWGAWQCPWTRPQSKVGVALWVVLIKDVSQYISRDKQDSCLHSTIELILSVGWQQFHRLKIIQIFKLYYIILFFDFLDFNYLIIPLPTNSSNAVKLNESQWPQRQTNIDRSACAIILKIYYQKMYLRIKARSSYTCKL